MAYSVRVNDPTQKGRYEGCLRELMSHFHNRVDRPYDRSHQFTAEQLNGLKPVDIYKWMCLKAYGKEDPGPDDNPTYGRASSLEYYKKAISHFMPNKLMAWNVISQVGNPTRSTEVNSLIKAVRKKEVRKQGKPSSADRAFEKNEFDEVINILESSPDAKRRYMYPAMFKFQFHFIARLDDTLHVRKDSIKVCDEFDFTVTTQLRWAKNVHDERDAPRQIMLGAVNPRYCILLALGIFLEVWIESGEVCSLSRASSSQCAIGKCG
jgi:hypothetical protein